MRDQNALDLTEDEYTLDISNRIVLKELEIGESEQIRASVLSASGDSVTNVSYSYATDETYVFVDDTGNVTVKKSGSGRLTVTVAVNGKMMRKTFYMTVVLGASVSITTKAVQNDFSEKTEGVNSEAQTWKSSNPKFASGRMVW